MTKVPDHVGFVPQQSIDKIGDLSTDNSGFCLQVCTKPTLSYFFRNFYNFRISPKSHAVSSQSPKFSLSFPKITVTLKKMYYLSC